MGALIMHACMRLSSASRSLDRTSAILMVPFVGPFWVCSVGVGEVECCLDLV